MTRGQMRTVCLGAAAVALLVALPVGCDRQEAPVEAPAKAKRPPAVGDEARVAAFLETHKLTGRVALIQFGLAGYPLSDQGLDTMVRMSTVDLPELAYLRVNIPQDPEPQAEAPLFDPGFPIVPDADKSLSKAFAVAIIGGLSSGMGVVVGGLILGIAETTTGFYLSTGYKDVPGLVLLLLVLTFKPAGLFTNT